MGWGTTVAPNYRMSVPTRLKGEWVGVGGAVVTR